MGPSLGKFWGPPFYETTHWALGGKLIDILWLRSQNLSGKVLSGALGSCWNGPCPFLKRERQQLETMH